VAEHGIRIQEALMNLDRFLIAQDQVYRGVTVFDVAMNELRAGAKQGHWIWFVFPQFPLGMSETARQYSIRDACEARAYLAHSVLGPRLELAFGIVDAAIRNPACDPHVLMASHVDCLKLVSSATLFALAAEPDRHRDLLDATTSILDAMQKHGFAPCEKTRMLWRP